MPIDERANEIAELTGALQELAEAARSACDARKHPPLTEALAKADELVGRRWRKVMRSMDDHHARELRRHWNQ